MMNAAHSSQASDDNAVLKIENLWVKIANKDENSYAISDISFSVHPGETVCLVGESGSGKSVTSLATMGLLAKSELYCSQGKIWLDGEDLLNATPSRIRALRASKMAMIFQEPMTALNPVERVGPQVEEVLKAHGIGNPSQRKQQVLEMFEAVHLPDPKKMYSAYPHQLSGGQRQRIVISMALILKPRLLIADEPTTALDVTTQKQILALIRELQEKQNTAVLFITHDFGVVAEFSDRIVVMNRGKMVETGTRDAILSNPTQDYTRMLVSSVPSLIPSEARAIAPDPILRVIDLNKTYEEKHFLAPNRSVVAADNVSFTLNRGEIVGIVGESGSGKSSVARCIMRLIEPSSGLIQLGDSDLAKAKGEALRDLRQRLQIVFQDPYRSLNPRLRIHDALLEGMENFGIPKAERDRRIAMLLDWVGMDTSALERYPHQFSGGQRQRLCIARALALEPDVLVADEAVSALDVSVQSQVLKLLDDMRQRMGIAVLFITHDLRVAAQICDQILVMQRGVVVEAGRAEEILVNPQHSYTQSLIEAAPGRHWDFQNFRPVDTATSMNHQSESLNV
ncbi:peptide/nickel transport system ATP-binding protein [Paenalcaligenes hominis]|uniref:Peptide/nickel transport system ATP-binding protein n=2 Tax=Paenalcaligenes hominis TaxID=643674 RepID=A0ABX0WLQ5_9BURK|nr:ABC transporter ATP-binding protein [Paenalcaligenes hominis]NJB64166.1 peptide/nickel transport system ATP-binding protein [Paenalcaligenes hominis]GGE75434.1 ABC transporter ATP-binding protein [Paenalcaligenes hominis]